jgi:hypothetical protein
MVILFNKFNKCELYKEEIVKYLRKTVKIYFEELSLH